MSYEILYLHDDMPFGKYNGEKVLHLLESDPDYLRWFAEAITRIEFDTIVQDSLTSEELRLDVINRNR